MRVLIALTVLIGLAALGLWLTRVEIAQRVAIAALEREGLEPSALSVKDLDFDRARATDIAIGPEGELRADSLQVDYSLGDLFSGRIGTLRIDGLEGSGKLTEDGKVSIPILDAVLGDGQDEGPAIPALPFEQIEFRDFAFTLETPADASFESKDAPIVVAGDAVLRRTGPDTVDVSIDLSDFHPEWEENLSLSGSLRAGADGGIDLDGQVEGTLDAQDIALAFDAAVTGAMAGGDLSVKMAFSRLDATTEIFQADGMSGQISYRTFEDAPQAVSVELDLPQARLFDQFVGPGHITVRRDGPRIALSADLESEAGRFSLGAEGDPDDRADPLTFNLDGAADPALLARLLQLPDAPAGTIEIAASGTLSPRIFATDETPEIDALLDALRMTATISPHLTDLDLPGIFRGAALAGDAGLSVDGRTVALSFLPGFGLTGLIVDSALSSRLPPEIAESLALDKERDLAVAGNRPLRIALAPTDAGYTITADGALAGHGAAPRPRIAVAGRMDMDADFEPGSIVAHSVDASLIDLRYEDMTGTVDLGLVDFKSAGGESSGEFVLHVAADGRPDASTELTDLKVDLNGGFTYADRALTVAPNDSSRLSLAGLRIDGDAIAGTPIALRIRSGEESTVTARASSPAGLDYDLRFAHAAMGLDLPDDGEPIPIALNAGSMRLVGSSESMILDWTVPAGTIDDLPIAFERLALHAVMRGLRGGLRGTARLRSTLRHLAEEDQFVLPLSLTMDARLAAGILFATAELKDTGERILITGDARHSFPSNSGEASLKAKRIEFLETVFQPEDLFPVLAERDALVDGAIDWAGSAHWTPGTFESAMELALDFRSIVSPETTLKDVAGVIRFDSLSPLTTPPDQIIAIGYADVGLPLEAGRLILQVKPGPIIHAEAKDFDLYGGRVYLDPIDYDPDDDQVDLVLGATGVRIEDLLAPARLGTLDATGVLTGRVPISIRDGKLIISDGILESVGGGRIRYIPEEIGEAVREVDEGTALFLDAVANFEYSVFRVTIDEAEGEEMVLVLEIDGRNPAVYEGVPIEIDIAVTGEVRELLYSGISIYELPERIKAALEEFEE